MGSGRSTSAWGAPSVHINDDGMQYPRRRPIASSIMGFEDEAERSKGRPCRQTNGRSKRTYSLTSSMADIAAGRHPGGLGSPAFRRRLASAYVRQQGHAKANGVAYSRLKQRYVVPGVAHGFGAEHHHRVPWHRRPVAGPRDGARQIDRQRLNHLDARFGSVRAFAADFHADD